MSPSANQVAWAIVAACRETGDDPIAVASGAKNVRIGAPALRARHYALHALLHVFQDLPKATAATLVGVPQKPGSFYNNSYHSVAKVVSGSGRRYANWWDENAYGRVIAAIEAVAPMAEAQHRSPIKLSAFTGSIIEPTRPAAIPGKRRLEDMLREAVANTQRMTPPPEE